MQHDQAKCEENWSLPAAAWFKGRRLGPVRLHEWPAAMLQDQANGILQASLQNQKQ